MRVARFLLTLWLPAAALAHLGSPDVYLDARAGPYQLFITVQPPTVIPGVAQVQVRAAEPGIVEMHAAPLGMTGAAAKYAPVADRLLPSKDDPRYFTGAVWLMQTGSFQVRITAQGAQGTGVVSVPMPAIAQYTLGMQPGLGAALFGLMSLLVVGLVAIAGAAVREAQLEPGIAPDPARRWRSRIIMGVVLAGLVALLWVGNNWWRSEAGAYDRYIYKPLQMRASLQQNRLLLTLHDPGWMPWRKDDDFVLDHNHLMHLYLIREPGLDVIYHLHPETAASGAFQLDLPSTPPGHYNLYADVVHRDGFPETLASAIDLPAIAGRALVGDDAIGHAPPVNQATPGLTECKLPDGYRMTFDTGNTAFQAKRPELFRFTLVDPRGAAPKDMAFYMGMLGHAAFIKTDGSVFAHIHPNGTVAMAAFMMAQNQTQPIPASAPDMTGMHPMGDMPMSLPNSVSFPYGFPAPGRYRIVVQMKHGAIIETGIFDALVH